MMSHGEYIKERTFVDLGNTLTADRIHQSMPSTKEIAKCCPCSETRDDIMGERRHSSRFAA